MKITLKRLTLGIASAGLLTIYGCGGGSGGTAATTSPTLTGTAATGAALANAPVAVSNSTGASPCVETSITTSALGSYTCTLKSGEVAPFFIVVTDPTGNSAPLVSVATSTPVAGTPLTVNATPLTTAILAQLATDGNPLTLVGTHAVNTADLQNVTSKVVTQLASVLDSIGTDVNFSKSYNPFSTSITAATSAGVGNTADMVLDLVKVVTDPATGKLALSTVSDPAPKALPTTTTAGTVVVAPSAGVSTLSQAAQVAAQTFANCFALPSAQRVLATNITITAANGGPEVTSVATACENVATNGANASPAFLHNGYRAGQLFYGLLTNDTMTGAKFSVPEIMAFYPADVPNGQPNDRAVLNIRYLDNAGNPGNVITVAANIPSTSTVSRPSNWWLVGNQQPVDVVVKLNIRRVEQVNPANANTNHVSTFQTGIQFNVNTTGPGSDNAGNLLKFARISGPGLPGNGAAGTGLVYVFSTGPQNSMDLFNKTGNLTAGSQCGNGTTFNCPNLWFARTAGVSGTAAATLTTNPAGLLWAQGAEVDPTRFVKGAIDKAP